MGSVCYTRVGQWVIRLSEFAMVGHTYNCRRGEGKGQTKSVGRLRSNTFLRMRSPRTGTAHIPVWPLQPGSQMQEPDVVLQVPAYDPPHSKITSRES